MPVNFGLFVAMSPIRGATWSAIKFGVLDVPPLAQAQTKRGARRRPVAIVLSAAQPE
jgi:hypothetical protein